MVDMILSPEGEKTTVFEMGIAFDREEHSLGISAIGVGFQSGPGGPIHAISVPMPTQRFAAKQKSVTAAIVAARAGILAELERLA